MSNFFQTLIEQRFAQYIDDILLLSNSNELMFQLIEQLHIISGKHNLQLALENHFFFLLLKVKNLGYDIGYNTIKPIQSKIAARHQFSSPTGKVALLSFIGALNFYAVF